MPSTPTELQLHKSLVLRLRKIDGLVVLHVPNGERRLRQDGAKLRDMGVLPGVADLFIFAGWRAPLAVEIKSARGRQSPAQQRFELAWRGVGGAYAVVRSTADADALVARLQP